MSPFLALLLPLALAAPVGIPVECAVSIRPYHQTFVWSGTRSRMRVQADEACAAQLGSPYRLRGVTLTLQVEGRPDLRLSSETGFWSEGRQRFVLGPARESGGPRILLVDLLAGEVRAPGIYFRALNR